MNLNKITNINLLFIFILIILSTIGSLALYSAGDGDINLWAKKHIIRFIISLILLFVISVIDIKYIYKNAYSIFLFFLLLLLSVELLGTLGKGAERWIFIFGISLQPSELIKVSLILALARFYHDLRFENIGSIRYVFFPMVIILLPTLLIIFQPDLGTAVTVFLLGILLMFYAGVRIWKFILGFTVTLISLPFLWNYIKPYQKKRILSFFNPESDPLGQGYQLIQSKIALGSGSVSGKGFLKGTQSYLEYLPEKQTDFIFTLIGEEFGFLGIIFIILLFITLIIISFYISLKSNHTFGKILSMGVSINLFLYVVLNMSMVTGLMPVVGIPLPLISYGGTVMLSIMISFGLLMNADLHSNYKKLD